MLSRIKFSIEPLVNEILDNLPASVWASTTTTFCDPSIGGGQFVREIERRLHEAGHSDKNIRGRVFGFESSALSLGYAINKYGLVGTYEVCDLLEKEFNQMKFDVIVGNPPYQAQKSGDYSLWARFVKKGNELLVNGGYLSLIIPTGWKSPTGDIRQGRISILRDIFAKQDTQYINLDPSLGKRYFTGIGQTFSWFLMKAGAYKTTTIDFGGSTIDLDISDLSMLPKVINEKSLSILKKITTKSSNKWAFKRHCMKESWSDIKFDFSKNHCHAKINGSSNHLDRIAHSSNPCQHQSTRKVVLPYRGSTFTFVVDNGKMGMTDSYFIPLSNTDKINSAKTYFGSSLIKWLGTNKYTQFNEGSLINTVSVMDLSVPITETDIYDYYSLTQEEIDYVEANTK